MKLDLVFPLKEQKEMWEDIVKEIEAAGEKIVPYALSFCQNDFDIFMQKTLDNLNDINVGNLVPSTTFFLMDENRSRILGAVNIRHQLNEMLLLRGGHIGYGVRPSERKKGYATEMLRLALDKCRELGIKKALITCDKGNTGSARTIIKNGGVLENEITEQTGNIIQRYWVEI